MNFFVVISLTLLFIGYVTATDPKLIDLLAASDHETRFNEELAELLNITYERQGGCGSGISPECCTSCTYDGYCYNGATCCEVSKVKSRILKSGENDCPNSWSSECSTLKLIPIESCKGKSNKGDHNDNYESHRHRGSGDSDSSSSESDEGRDLEKSGMRLMCICLQTKRCCSGYLAPTTSTTPTTSASG